MNTPVSDNTKAILLVAAPLLVGGKQTNGAKILSVTEYNQLARLLRERNAQPADLLSSSASALLGDLRLRFDTKRLDELLARGFLLSQAIEKWSSQAIRVVSRADLDYPRRFKTKLGQGAPPLLYGRGDWALLNGGGLAVVGSRHVDESLIEFAQKTGDICAAAGVTIISGGAKGIDRAAMEGSLMASGRVVGVMAGSLAQAVVAPGSRESIREERLILISPFDPSAGFNVGNAMQRNKLIYALADAALVINSDYQKGGTWAGAIEQIERFHACTVFARADESASMGNKKLIEAGARTWPNPKTPNELSAILSNAISALPVAPNAVHEGFLPGLRVREEPATKASKPIAPVSAGTHGATEASPAAELLNTVHAILAHELVKARTEKEIAELLGVQPKQAAAWLTLFVERGVLTKTKRPVRYVVSANAGNVGVSHLVY